MLSRTSGNSMRKNVAVALAPSVLACSPSSSVMLASAGYTMRTTSGSAMRPWINGTISQLERSGTGPEPNVSR